MSVYKVL